MTSLTRKQFDVMEVFIRENKLFSQRELVEKTNHSLGTINKVIKELIALGCISDGNITELGYKTMEQYAAKRAIFIAAGFGSRLVPITFNTPKPLVRVHGQRIIDGLIDACLEAGIDDIYIVRGYLSEQFDQLLYKYPTIKFIENPNYNESNNISSALMARDLLENSYIFDADLLIKNPKIITKYHYSSDFLGIKTNRTDDWCLIVKDGVIKDERIGGEGDNVWQIVGISYWNKADGKQLHDDLKKVYDSPGGKENYWEQVPLVICRGNYKVRIRDCQREDVVEIDTFNELKAVDKTYNT